MSDPSGLIVPADLCECRSLLSVSFCKDAQGKRIGTQNLGSVSRLGLTIRQVNKIYTSDLLRTFPIDM